MMRFNFIILLSFLITMVGCLEKQLEQDQMEVQGHRLESCIACKIYDNLEAQYPELNIGTIAKELSLLALNKRSRISKGEYERYFAQRYLEEEERLASTNLLRAEEYLNGLKEQSDVIEGKAELLYYKIVHYGDGGSHLVENDDIVTLDLTELDMDGRIIPNGKKGGITLKVSETIPGFSAGIIGMAPNERRIVYIHPDLGYGKLGKSEPNQLLIYDVTLLSKKEQ